MIIFVVISPAASVEEKETIDFSELHERFDRIETGIVNLSVDFCFSNGGTYLTDPSGNILVQESQLLDENTGQPIPVRMIVCLLQ